MNLPKVFVIILNWNGKSDTLACLKSMQKVTYENYYPIVVDNGSVDDSVSAIQNAYPHVHVIETHENLGFAEGNNVGIKHALANGADHLYLLNNDTIVDPKILDAFVSLSQKQEAPTILGGRVYLFDKPDTFDHLGGNWNPRKGNFDLVALRQIDDQTFDQPLVVDYVCGCSLFAPAVIFEKLEGLDKRFFLYWEESDFCMRAKSLGYPSMYCPEAKLWHKVSASITGGKSYVTYFFWRNRLLWMKKNLPFRSRLRIFLKILFPEINHTFKLNLLKTLELYLLKGFYPQRDRSAKELKVARYRAALKGVFDYLMGRYGNAPKSLLSRRKVDDHSSSSRTS